MEAVAKFYPPIEPYRTATLGVGGEHVMAYEMVGNAEGIPLLFLHNLGVGCRPEDRQLFDPELFQIVMPDQRGSGRSVPAHDLKENTTENLVADLELLRDHLGIQQWVIAGAGWGATLALVYAQIYPERVHGLLLKSIRLGTQEEVHWMFEQGGAANILPEAYEQFGSLALNALDKDALAGYARQLNSSDLGIRQSSARQFLAWLLEMVAFEPNSILRRQALDSEYALNVAQLCVHFLRNRCFLQPNQIMHNVHRLKQIPGFIVQPRYDLICPPSAAWHLHKHWPGSKLTFVEDAGHLMTEQGNLSAWLDAQHKLYERIEKSAKLR